MKHLLIILFLLLSSSVFSQTIGIVIIDEKNQAIEDVTVANEDFSIFGVSNSKGKISLKLKNSNETFTFQHPSYFTISKTIDELKNINNKIKMIEKTIILDETVISVTKNAQQKSNVSNEVEIITKREIEFYQPSTTADMLENTGNVFVQKSQFGGGSPVIRGFEANKVLLVVDGVRLNNAIYRGGHLQNVITIDEAMLERTEVVFGPGSLIYGSDALGGVMHFYTRDPKLAYEDSSLNIFGNASFRYGSASHEKTGHFDFNIGGKKFASLTSISFSDFDDLRSGRNRNPLYGDWGLTPRYVETINGVDSVLINEKPHIQKRTSYQQVDVLQKFLFAPSEYLNITLNTQFSTSSNVPRFDRLVETRARETSIENNISIFSDTTISSDSTFSENNLRFAEWYYGPQTRFLGALNFEITKPNIAFDNSSITLSYQYINESRNERRINSPILEKNVEKVNVATLNADFKKSIGTKSTFFYGLESNFNTVNSIGEAENIETDSTFEIQSRYPENGSILITNAIYAKHTLKIAKRATFSQGIRINQAFLKSEFSERTFSGSTFSDVVLNPIAASYSFDFSFLPKNDWQVNLLFSSGYRVPNVDDIGKVFDPNPQEIVIPNSELKPEYAYNFETGLSKKIADKVKIDVVGYFSLLSNIIVRQPITLNGQDSILVDEDNLRSQVLANVNDGLAYITGFSVNFKGELVKNLILESSFNYTYGILTESNEPMSHIPPIFGRTAINYTYKNWRTSVWSQYQGWKRVQQYSTSSVDNLNEATPLGTPAWFTLNFTNSIEISKNFTLNLSVENILDKHYRPFSSSVSAAGRNFVLGIRGSF